MTYFKKLRHKTIQNGYVYASVFEQNPTSVFLCVWPANPEIKKRANLFVQKSLKEEEEEKKYHLFLECPQEVSQKTMIFYKTATCYDESLSFFWKGARGGRFQLKSEELKEKQVLFRYQKKGNNNLNFLNLLLTVGRQIEVSNSLNLSEYMKKNFDICTSGTYAFEAYLEVPIQKKEIEINGKMEVVYQLAPGFPFEEVDVKGIMYKYLPNSQRKTIGKDPKIMEKTIGNREIRNDFQLEIHNVVKDCIQDFFSVKKDKTVHGEECEELTVKIFEAMKELL